MSPGPCGHPSDWIPFSRMCYGFSSREMCIAGHWTLMGTF